MRNIIRVTIIAAITAWPLFGQAGEWPFLLGIPRPAVATDSNRTEYGSDQNLYIRTFKAKDSLAISKNTASYGFNQNFDFELTNDSWFDTKDQYFDLSGETIKKGFPLGISAGLEWTPVLLLKQKSSLQGMLGSVEAGPVVKFAPLGIPISLHGGASGRGINDSLTSISTSQLGLLQRDKGYYAGAELGAPAKPLPFLPLYINANGYGRSMGTSKLLAGTASALFYYGFPSGDSLFARYDDSLTNGRDAFLGQAQGKPHVIDDPEKNERSYELLAGIRGKPRYFFIPGAYYSYSEHTLSYAGEFGNRKNTANTVGAVLKTDPLFLVSYSGGITLTWEREDRHAFFASQTSGGSNLPPNLFMIDREGNVVSLDDNQGYRISMIHSLSKYFSNGMGAEYISDISRFSKDYPNFFVVNGDTVRRDPPLDNDIIINRQKVTLVPIPSAWAKMTVFGEYSKNLTNYIRKEMSGNNTIDWFYRVGGTFDATIFERCTLSEALSADAKVTRYVFPETKRGKPPPYSRKLSSLAVLDAAVTGWLNLKTEWGETYWDYGTWNGREYLDSSSLALAQQAAAYKDYYAIVDKTWQHSLTLSAAVRLFDLCFINAGCSYQYLDVRQFDQVTREYSLTNYAGSRVSPTASLSYQIGPQLLFKAAVVRTFDIRDKFWDVHVSLNGAF
jgi:hypothetical protein